MSVLESDCAKRMADMSKMIELNTDLNVIRTFDNDFQVAAYKRLKQHEERKLLIKNCVKVAAFVNAMVGALTVILEIFI